MNNFTIDNHHKIFTIGSIYKNKKSVKRKRKYKYTNALKCNSKQNQSHIFTLLNKIYICGNKTIELGLLYCILKIHIASSLKQKYYTIKTFLRNKYFNESLKNRFIMYLCTYQMFCMHINTIKSYHKRKKYKLFPNDFTLSFISLSEIQDSHKIKIVQNNTMYEFSMKELLTLCHNSLSYSEYLLSIPSLPKNPYTNIEFTKNIMYILYVKSIISHIKLPVLFESFIRYHMDFDLFYEYNSYQLNWISCIHYVDKLEDLSKLNYINQLLNSYTRYRLKGAMSQNNIDELIHRSKKMLCCNVFIVNFEPSAEIVHEKSKIIRRCIHDIISNYKSFICLKPIHKLNTSIND